MESCEHDELAVERIGTFNNEGRDDVEQINQAARELIALISKHCPNGRRKSTAMTEVETAKMYAISSIFNG